MLKLLPPTPSSQSIESRNPILSLHLVQPGEARATLDGGGKIDASPGDQEGAKREAIRVCSGYLMSEINRTVYFIDITVSRNRQTVPTSQFCFSNSASAISALE